MEEKIVLVLNEMSEYLTIPQMKKLQEVIIKNFAENEVEKTNISNDEFLKNVSCSKADRGVFRANNKLLSDYGGTFVIADKY